MKVSCTYSFRTRYKDEKDLLDNCRDQTAPINSRKLIELLKIHEIEVNYLKSEKEIDYFLKDIPHRKKTSVLPLETSFPEEFGENLRRLFLRSNEVEMTIYIDPPTPNSLSDKYSLKPLDLSRYQFDCEINFQSKSGAYADLIIEKICSALEDYCQSPEAVIKRL